MPEDKIKLGVVEHENETSYVSLYKHLENVDLLNEENFRKIFNDIEFQEEVGYEYNSLPIYVGWAYVPVITDGLVEIKVLKIEQGNGIAIILPENVAHIYKELEEDVTKLEVFNTDLDLVGDLYGLDETDVELTELIKRLYINVGNKADAFKLTVEGESEKEDKKEKDEEDTLAPGGFGLDSPGENIPFGDIDTNREAPVEEAPEIAANEEAYKRFSKDTNNLNILLETLYKKTPIAVREHISTKFIAEEKILLIRVDNKNIYETFNTIPKHARAQISAIGEAIRLSKETQLVDSFKDGDGRIFILAENSHSNIWVVKGEENKPFNEKTDKKLYISKESDIIELGRSNIRQENRRFVPRIKEDTRVFSVK